MSAGNGGRVRRHDVADGYVAAAAFGHDAGPEVAVREDPDPTVGGGHQEARDALPRHLGRGIGDPRVRIAGHGRTLHERADRAIAPGVGLGAEHLLVPADPSAVGVGDELLARRSPQDPGRDVRVDQVTQRVLGRPHGRARCDVAEQRPHAEHLALAGEIDHAAVVDDLDGPLADHIEESRRGAGLLEDHDAGREVLDLHAGDGSGEVRLVQVVERPVPGEEGRDVHPRSVRGSPGGGNRSLDRVVVPVG